MLAYHEKSHPKDELVRAYNEIDFAHRKYRFYSNTRPKRTCFEHDANSLQQLSEGRLNRIILVTSSSCNLRCAYCQSCGSYSERQVPKHELLSFEVARKALDFVKASSKLSDKVVITFYGGEPLLNWSVIQQCVTYARTAFHPKHVNFILITNGTLLNEEICRFLIAHDFKLTVSLDGPQPIHDRYRREISGRGTFETIRQNLQRLQALNPAYFRDRVRFNLVMAPPCDYEMLSEFINTSDLVKEQSINLISVNSLDTTFPAKVPRTSPEMLQKYERLKANFFETLSKEDINHDRIKREHRLMQELFTNTLLRFASRLGPKESFTGDYRGGGYCIPGTIRLLVRSDGLFFPCEKVDSSKNDLSIGNVDTGLDIGKILNLVDTFSAAHGDCWNCPVLRHCSLCFMGQEDPNGPRKYDGKARCAQEVAAFEKRLRELMMVRERDANAFLPIELEVANFARRNQIENIVRKGGET